MVLAIGKWAARVALIRQKEGSTYREIRFLREQGLCLIPKKKKVPVGSFGFVTHCIFEMKLKINVLSQVSELSEIDRSIDR